MTIRRTIITTLTKDKKMINPNATKNTTGVIKEVINYTSMTVYKIQTKHGIFDYTLFGAANESLAEGIKLSLTIGYSITLNGYFVRNIGLIYLQSKKAA